MHKNLVMKFPASLFLSVEPLKYKPITSDITDEVIKTGKDNKTILQGKRKEISKSKIINKIATK